jgi:hypothetical protein
MPIGKKLNIYLLVLRGEEKKEVRSTKHLEAKVARSQQPAGSHHFQAQEPA